MRSPTDRHCVTALPHEARDRRRTRPTSCRTAGAGATDGEVVRRVHSPVACPGVDGRDGFEREAEGMGNRDDREKGHSMAPKTVGGDGATTALPGEAAL